MVYAQLHHRNDQFIAYAPTEPTYKAGNHNVFRKENLQKYKTSQNNPKINYSEDPIEKQGTALSPVERRISNSAPNIATTSCKINRSRKYFTSSDSQA
ncbi:hypothetical protein O181_083224 [Austropuccinia psidii MF-1]|uniref:Uncharacterized protein n=1 Tax=Austropuccinia psidii MF-1 TaxID=1389203 RepID=A0A9Q3FQS1_9BASI|nr:hypothetical protein [Austropuccinia psidii MF-1]